ncbi:conjugal transfer protein TraF [Polaromonas sp.]|jgi:conjugal transfer pilus assembly protein TraF|uniref:conjugal transfer protein TraF n=1 Tax=Polaromonas sp. TaxID=1869339 RepID=UPI002487D358|nr:conjugal transfer protein TraF [Polaromonas sp.]MDI1339778.1 conjugal transfer protein TraF [Polaromonas sp.]MDO9258453.1 conjugal transfer protein TraF [Polaromonas sp.]
MNNAPTNSTVTRLVTVLCAVWLTAGALPASAQDASRRYWSDTWRGWHFYEDPEPDGGEGKPAVPPKTVSPAVPVPVHHLKAHELAAFERLQKNVEETRNIAIMQPTEANVRRYMELESQVVERASYFADVAQRVAWATPELDPTLQGRPVGAKALEVFEKQQLTDRSRSIAHLGRDHVLFFFYRADCPYCHAFAPTLEAFQARHGIKVVAIGVDGGPMPGFPDARADNGIATTLKVTQVPAVLLAQPFTGKITPIGFGVLSEAQLLERIALVSTPQSDAMVPGTSRLIGRLSVSP